MPKSRSPLRWLIAPAVAVCLAAALLARAQADASLADPADESITAGPDLAADPALDAQRKVILERINYKEELTRKLIDGRATLDEVTAEFLRLNREAPACLATIRSRYPGASDEEMSARNVLDFVRVQNLSPDQRKQVIAKLSGEIDQKYGPQNQEAE